MAKTVKEIMKDDLITIAVDKCNALLYPSGLKISMLEEDPSIVKPLESVNYLMANDMYVTETTVKALNLAGYEVAMKCKICGCTDSDCGICVDAQGHPCHWVAPSLCSRCSDD